MFCFRIDMSKVDKILGAASGNGVVTKYRNARFHRGLGVGGAIMDFSFAAQHALDSDVGWTAVFGGFTCLMVKLTKDCHDTMTALRPQYKAIVARAKQIYYKK